MAAKKRTKKAKRRTGGEASKVQSLLFSKKQHQRGKKPWTKRTARSWASQHKFRAPEVDETASYYRLRQFEPDSGRYDYRTIPFGTSGIKAVIAWPKRSATRLPPRLRAIEGGAPAHVLQAVNEQLTLRRAA